MGHTKTLHSFFGKKDDAANKPKRPRLGTAYIYADTEATSTDPTKAKTFEIAAKGPKGEVFNGEVSSLIDKLNFMGQDLIFFTHGP